MAKKNGAINPPTGVWVERRYVVRLGADLAAAMLFAQIVYWHKPGKNGKTKLRVPHEGCLWLSKSAPEWHAELGLTKKQVYRGIPVLEAAGLIATDTWMFDGHPTTHVRLTEEGRDLAFGGNIPIQLPSKANPFPLLGISITETTAESTTEIDSASKLAKTVNPKSIDKDHEEDMKLENGGKKNKLKLADTWQTAVAEHYPDYENALTAKECGQLKQYQTKVGPRAAEVLRYAVAHWEEFAMTAQFDAGLAASPEKPRTGFLLKHYEVVLKLMADEAKKQAAYAQQQASVNSPPKTQTVTAQQVEAPADAANEVYKATPEQIAATLMMFGKLSAY